MGERWFRDDFADAVWRSETLKPLERLVALAYAEFLDAKDVKTRFSLTRKSQH